MRGLLFLLLLCTQVYGLSINRNQTSLTREFWSGGTNYTFALSLLGDKIDQEFSCTVGLSNDPLLGATDYYLYRGNNRCPQSYCPQYQTWVPSNITGMVYSGTLELTDTTNKTGDILYAVIACDELGVFFCPPGQKGKDEEPACYNGSDFLPFAFMAGVSVPVVTPSEINITLSKVNFTVGEQVFANVTTNTFATYIWSFGDNSNTTKGSSANHTYQAEGKYSLNVTASNPLGSAVATVTVFVTKKAAPTPTPTATAAPTSTPVKNHHVGAKVATAAIIVVLALCLVGFTAFYVTVMKKRGQAISFPIPDAFKRKKTETTSSTALATSPASTVELTRKASVISSPVMAHINESEPPPLPTTPSPTIELTRNGSVMAKPNYPPPSPTVELARKGSVSSPGVGNANQTPPSPTAPSPTAPSPTVELARKGSTLAKPNFPPPSPTVELARKASVISSPVMANTNHTPPSPTVPSPTVELARKGSTMAKPNYAPPSATPELIMKKSVISSPVMAHTNHASPSVYFPPDPDPAPEDNDYADPPMSPVESIAAIPFPVFQGDLAEKTAQINNSTILPIVWSCCEYIEKLGLDVEGIFRIPGNMQEMRDLKAAFDRGHIVDLEAKVKDPLTVAGLLKFHFREGREENVPKRSYAALYQARNNPSSMRNILLCDFTPLQITTLRRITYTFTLICSQAEINLMHPDNLAKVFGPSLFRDMPFAHANAILVCWIKNYSEIFDF